MLTPNHLIIKEFQEWVKDFRFSRSRDIKVFRVMQFYWLVKTLVSLSMKDKEDN